MDFLSAMSSAFVSLMDPERLLYLMLGVVVGTFLGVIPGIGGMTGMAILLPFAFSIDTTAALGMMVGMLSSVHASDIFSAVLLAIPGSSSAQASILDGHPLARRGEAGRALGASFSSALFGGIIGAVVLTVSVQVARPIILLIGSPELFMLGMLGILMTATLSGNAPIKGIVSGALGLVLGMVGLNMQTGAVRLTFGSLYLFEGISITIVALGLFAVPEIADLMMKGTRISENEIMKIGGGLIQGVRDTVRHWFLVIRTGIIGLFVGAIPGLGGGVVDWLAYGHALQTEKGAKETFGKGDIRGVIGVDAAANAKDGGALLPTLLLGVPGSAPMALFLYLFRIHGLQPGPSMVSEHYHITLSIIWSFLLANIFAALLCFILASQIIKITTIPIHVLSPIIIVIITFAAYQSNRSLGDITLLFACALLGWLMKRNAWPRPPLLLGIVLSPLLERYLFISVNRYGLEWLTHPTALIIGLLAVISVVFSFKPKQRDEDAFMKAGG